MNDVSDATPAQLQDPNFDLLMGPRVALGLQHVLAMFASNVTPSIIIAGAAGFAFGGADMVFLIQMAMLFAGVATLFQTIGFGPVGARLSVMQGTSFAFVPIMISIVKSSGIAALFGAVLVAGAFHAALGAIIGRIRHWFPPLVTGMVITAIGLYLLPVGIKYAAGGAADFQMNNPAWGDFSRWGLALVVILLRLVLHLHPWHCIVSRHSTWPYRRLSGWHRNGRGQFRWCGKRLLVYRTNAVQIWNRVQRRGDLRHVPDFDSQRDRDSW